MSNALPMALLRPSCAAVRSAAPVAQQWSAVTAAFARRFCSSRPAATTTSRPSLLSVLRQQKPYLAHSSRSFAATSRACASPHDPDATTPGTPRKRQVRIGRLPGGDVDANIIRTIFGSAISVTDGNNVLRILHHRRISGSLADYGVDNLGQRYVRVSQKMATKALQWLRSRYPIDEARAAEEWAEKEANRISYELWLADPENADSKWNDPARRFRQEQEEEQQRQEEEAEDAPRIGILRAGRSQFERNIERKRRERLEAVTQKAEEKEARAVEEEKMLATGEYVRTPRGTALMKPGQEAYVDVFGREQISRRKEMMEHYQKKSQTAFTSEEEMLKATTLAQRLVPMTSFVFVLCLVCYGFAHYYVPPSPEYRLLPQFSPTVATLAAIVGINCVVCALWRVAPLWPIMTRFFMHVPGYPRAIQSFLNPFSHVQYEHLLGNMFSLALFGALAHDLVGRGVFLGTYIAAGAVGTIATLYWANLGRGIISAHSVGASAAVYGIVMLYLFLTDQESVKIPFGGEVTFWPKALGTAMIALEVSRAFKKGGGVMDHASHVGGIITGLSVVGYLRATGFHEKRKQVVSADTVQERAQGQESKTVDPAGVLKEELREIEHGVLKILKEDEKKGK